MRKVHILLVSILMFPIVAAAQNLAGGGDAPSSQSSSPSFSGAVFAQWQLAIGYQYNRINLTGTPMNTHGLDTTITRYFGGWFGVDGQLGVGLSGNTGASTAPPNLSVHSLFVGGGPRLAYRRPSRVQPWLHFVVGLQDFRITQTAGILGSNKSLAWEAGGGADFPLSQHFAFRVEADQIGTHLFSTYQRHFQVISGLVISF